jgi:hypothetical protein
MSALALQDNEPIERDPDLVHADLNGETVMLSITGGRYFGLNEIGSRIWALLATPTTLDAIQSQLTAEYEVDEAQCRRELEAFIGEMLRLGLVRPCAAQPGDR